ncbi:nuclear transport factor 2 family protein [Bradyrhizobium sp. B097]|uniref:nuclear transport factor 2 family protein n=1 Tax=Bradyrhizobium sp. B097 TaxID=3140244 RepID=UPI0031842E6D
MKNKVAMIHGAGGAFLAASARKSDLARATNETQRSSKLEANHLMDDTNIARQDDLEAINQTLLDYIEGFYDGNEARMESSLHPELAKRIANLDSASGRGYLAEMSALALTQLTRKKADRPTPAAERVQEIAVFDIFENAASARVTASTWIDYLHLSRLNGRWVIVNVLWEMKAGQPFKPYW